jgi:hypothetical protein
MDVRKSDVDVLSNEKEGEVSSTCSDSLPASSLSNNYIETGAEGIAPSSVTQEEIIRSDLPDTSGGSSGQGCGEVHVRAEVEESELSPDTEHPAIVQSQDADVEQENLRAVSAEMFQHLPGETIELLNISEGSEIVLLDENVLISTTSEPATFLMSYENQEEIKGAEMSTIGDTGLQLEISRPVSVSSAGVSENIEPMDVSSNETNTCTWKNPDSTTVDTADGSSDGNGNISFIEEEVSTTEEDAGNLVSTSSTITSVIENVLDTSRDSTSVPSTTKTVYVCGVSVQQDVQDMQASEGQAGGAVIIETAQQNSGISTTSAKDISQQRRRWDQVKPAAVISPVKQESSESQTSDPVVQMLNSIPQPSTCGQESHVTVPDWVVCTSKKPVEHINLSNPVQDCVSSSKDTEAVNKISAHTNVFPGHEESNIDTTTKVSAIPLLSSALDLIKSNYCSPFDDDIPSPGSCTYEEQKYVHDLAHQTGECSTSNSSSSEQLHKFTKDETSSLATSSYQEKMISESNTSSENLEGKTFKNELKGDIKIRLSLLDPCKESKEKRETLLLENASASSVAEHDCQVPLVSVKQSEIVLSKPSMKTTSKDHTAQHTSLAEQTVPSFCRPSVNLRTNLLGDLKEMVTSDKRTAVIDANALVTAEKNSGFVCATGTEEIKRQIESYVITDTLTTKRKSMHITEGPTRKEPLCVTELQTTGKQPFSVITETVQTTQKSYSLTNSVTSKKKSSVVEASARTESVTEAPSAMKECPVLTEVPIIKETNIPENEKDTEISLKGRETLCPASEMSREKEVQADGLKVSTVEEESAVLGMKSFVLDEQTSVAVKLQVKEKETPYSATITPMEEKDISSVDETMKSMGVGEAADNKQVSMQGSLAAGLKDQLSLREASVSDMHTPRQESKMSAKQTQMKAKETSDINKTLSKETSVTGIEAPALEEELKIMSEAHKVSTATNMQGTLRVPNKEGHSKVVCVPSKEKEIIVLDTQISYKEVTSFIHPQGPERDTDNLGLQEQVNEKESSTVPGKHTSVSAMPLPVLRSETHFADTHTQKKDEASAVRPKALEKDSGSVMEALEANTAAADVMLPSNKDKEIIRKRLAEVIAKQKSPTDSRSSVTGAPSTKMHTVVNKEFPALAENLAAVMKETIKKAISKIPEKSDLETVASKRSLVGETASSTSLSTALVIESDKQQADAAIVEGLSEVTNDCTDEGNLTSVTRNPSVSVEFSVKTEDSLHRLGKLFIKEAVPQTVTAVRLGSKETLLMKQTDFEDDTIIAEQLVLSKDVDKKEEKLTRENITVKSSAEESSRKETQKFAESLGAVANKEVTESSGAVISEQLKSSVSPPKKQRVKLVRPVFSKSRETNKTEYSLSVTPVEVTKSEPLNSPTLKETAVETAVGLSQMDGKEISIPFSMTLEKYSEIFQSVSSTGEAGLPCKGSENSEFLTATELKELEVLSKTLAKKVEKQTLSSTSEKSELVKSTEILRDRLSRFSSSTCPGEIKKLELPSEEGEERENSSAEVTEPDVPISLQLQDVTGPKFLESLMTESTEKLGLSSKAASKELPRLVASGEELGSLSLREKVPPAAEDIVRLQDLRQMSREIQQSHIAGSSEHSEIMQSSVSALAVSKKCKHTVVETVVEPDTCKNFEQHELLPQKDRDILGKHKPLSALKLQEVLEKNHAISETVKKQKLIRPLKSPSKDVAQIETVSGPDVNETIQKEGAEEFVIKQEEEGWLYVHQHSELCSERKGHEKTLSSTRTEIVHKSHDQNTLTSSYKMLGGYKSNVQESDESERHSKTVRLETVSPVTDSDKERCQLNLQKRRTNREVVHEIAAASRTETPEVGRPHSTSIDTPKGEELMFTARSRESKEDVCHSDIIKGPVPNSSNRQVEQKEVITDKRNIEHVSEELASEETSLIYKHSQHLLQSHPTASSRDYSKCNLVESKPAGGDNFPLQSQFKSEVQKINPGNISCSTTKKEAAAEVCLFKDTECTTENLSSGQLEISSGIVKNPAVDVKSSVKTECSTSTAMVTMMLDTHASEQHDKAVTSDLVDAINVTRSALEGKADETLVQDTVSLKASKREDKGDCEINLQELSTEMKCAGHTTASPKVIALKSGDIKDSIHTSGQKSKQVVEQNRIIQKISKDVTASKESSGSGVKEVEVESNAQNSENILKHTIACTEVISKPETSVESGLVSPNPLGSREHTKLEKLTLKPNKDSCSESFTKDGTNLKSSCTSEVSSSVEHYDVEVFPKHENVNIKFKKKKLSSLSFKGTSTADNAEISPKTENAEEIARVEKLTLKLKKDVSKPEDVQMEYIEEPKLEKITLKFKIDPAHHDVRVASTSTVMSSLGEIITISPGSEQVESIASPTSQDESKPQKITLKLKKDGAKQETIPVTSTGDIHLETSVAAVQSTEIQVPGTQLSVLNEEIRDDKIPQKLKKIASKSDTHVSPTKDVSQEMTVIPIKLKDGKVQEKFVSTGSKDKATIEKFTLKLKKDGASAATSKEDIHPEITAARVKASEAKWSNENISGGPRTEPLVEKITLKLKKDTAKPEPVHPETSVTQVKSTEQPKPEAHVSLSPKEDPVVEKITLKLKKEGTRPETILTSSKIIFNQETAVVPSDITDVRQKQLDESVSTLTKESTVVEKITLKIKKDHSKQEVTPTPSKQGHTKLTKGSTPVTQDEPKLEKLTLKLKKDIIKSALVSGREVESPKQPDLVTKLDFVTKEENKVEKLTLKLKKDLAMSEVSTGKKLAEQESGLLDVQNTEESVVAMSREEGKVEKLTLKFKKTELPEGDSEITSTQAEDVKCVDSAAASNAKEGKVEKITLKLKKDLTKLEEPSISSPKEIVDTDGASDYQISGEQEKKVSEETSSEAGKQKKITLTLKKDAAWSVKRKKIKPEDNGDNFKQAGGTEMIRLSTQSEDHTEPPLKRAKMGEETAVSEKSDVYITSSVETAVIISKVSEDLPSETGQSRNSMEIVGDSRTEEIHAHGPQKDFNRQETLESRRPEEECPLKKIKLEMNSSAESECKMSRSLNQDRIAQHIQEVSSSQILHSESEGKTVSEGEKFVQTAVEGKLRQILSKMCPRTNIVLSGDLSVSHATIKTVPSVRSPEMSVASVTSSQNEMMKVKVLNSAGSEDMHIYVTNAMQQSADVNQHFSEVLAGEESSSQGMMIVAEENQLNSSVYLNIEKTIDDGMAVPDYHMERAGTEESLEVKAVEKEVMKMEPKKGRGRPRKTALVPSVIPVVEPQEQVLRPKRMCRGRERPPVVVKVRKPRVGKGE